MKTTLSTDCRLRLKGEPEPAVSDQAIMKGVRRFFSKRAKPEDVDDLMQEVALRMEVRGPDRPISNITGYIFQVARNVLVDRLRSDIVRERAAHDPLEDIHHPIDSRSPERVLEGKEQLARAMKALETLPDRTRQAFVLHRFDDMSYAQIACHMGVSVSGVEKHIMRAMRLIAAQLDDQ